MLTSQSRVLLSKLRNISVRNYTAPLKDMKFLINEVYNFPDTYKEQKKIGGENATPDMIDSVLEETAKFAQDVLAPIVVSGDKEGCKYVDKHTIITPPGFKDAYKLFVEGGWQVRNKLIHVNAYSWSL